MVFHLLDKLGASKTEMSLQIHMNKIVGTAFSHLASHEGRAKELLTHLSSGQLDANSACGPQIFDLQDESATVAPETALATGPLKQAAYEALATGILKQAVHDLRRFYAAS